MIVAWWSGGITSAIACHFAVKKYDAKLIFIETGGHHPDTQRFKKDCEKWYGKEISTIQQYKYIDHLDCVEKRKFINSPNGAQCTSALKRRVREEWEKTNTVSGYVWGFDASEKNRADRMPLTAPNYAHHFPLIDFDLSKQQCADILTNNDIVLPEMYRLGFHNNNCVGCVKGGMAYWNLIRQHFPDTFNRMSAIERKIGASCLKKFFLDELPPDAGRGRPPIVANCGATGEGCMTELSRDFYYRD